MISCGEPSGDLYAGALATEIRPPRSRDDNRRPRRRRASSGAGAALTADFSGMSVTGLLEVARVLPRTYATYRTLVRAGEGRIVPDVFVAIDFPDFNFRLARAVRKLGVPVVYYISPQLWAWRRGRMKTMRRDRRSGAGDLPVRGSHLREAGVPGAVGRTSAARCAPAAAAARRVPEKSGA